MKALSGLDAAFLYLETPSAPMNVVCTIVLEPPASDGPCGFERILRLVEERLPRLAPFRRRLMPVPFGIDHPVWVEDPDLAVEDHVYRTEAPAPGTDRILAQLVAEIAARPLDRSRPLWELWVIERLSGGRTALVLKLHHAVADGVAGAELWLQLLDLEPNPPAGRTDGDPWDGDAPPSQIALLGRAVGRLARRPAQLARLLARTGRSAAGLARSTLDPAASGARPALPLGAPRTRFNGAISPHRAVAYGSARLANLEFVKATFGATLNDVVLAACSLSLRNYLEAHGDLPDGPLLATVPVSVRTPEQMGTYGNRLSAFFVHLPVHLADPLEQLRAIQAETRAGKHLQSELGGGLLGDWLQLASPALFSRGAQLYSSLKLANRHRPIHNLVISNVPGPPVPLYAAGSRVAAAYPHGPIIDGVGINITVVSYVDSVDFGIIACRESVPDIWDIALGFGAAVGDLVKLSLRETPQPPSRSHAATRSSTGGPQGDRTKAPLPGRRTRSRGTDDGEGGAPCIRESSRASRNGCRAG